MEHSQFKDTYLGSRYRESVVLGYQCVALVKLYTEKVFGKRLGYFSGSALNGRKKGLPPFDETRRRVTPGTEQPQEGDIIFFEYKDLGHVACVDKGYATQVDIIEQNGGRGSGDGLGDDSIRRSTRSYDKCLGWFTKRPLPSETEEDRLVRRTIEEGIRNGKDPHEPATRRQVSIMIRRAMKL